MYAMHTDGWESVLEMAVDVYRPDDIEGGHDRPVLVSLRTLFSLSLQNGEGGVRLFILAYAMCICPAELRHHSISRHAENIIRQRTGKNDGIKSTPSK
jgi:hypothetical protein